jgi:hypothetical protein
LQNCYSSCKFDKVCYELSFVLEFVQGVADFKSYIDGYQYDSAAQLIGLREMHFLKFYVDSK